MSFKGYVYSILASVWAIKQRIELAKVKGEDLFVVDIDNTLTINELHEKINLDNPRKRVSMVACVTKLYLENQRVIFLSARDFRSKIITYRWLNSCFNGNVKFTDLYLVTSSFAKVVYLKRLLRQKNKITFIDDLTYNHENGQVLRYGKTMDEVKKLNIKYVGLDFINSDMSVLPNDYCHIN